MDTKNNFFRAILGLFMNFLFDVCFKFVKSKSSVARCSVFFETVFSTLGPVNTK